MLLTSYLRLVVGATQSSVSSVLDDDDASATVCDGNTSPVRGLPAPGGVNPG